MIAPIVEKDATVRTVYLPEDMTQVCYDGKDFHCTPCSQGEHQVQIPYDQVVFYIRKGKLLPVGKAATNSREVTVDDLVLLGDGESYELYWDDGITRDCTQGNVKVLKKDF